MSYALEREPYVPTKQVQACTNPTVALIPAYNEERFIGSLVLAVSDYVDIVVVVDDGSQDRTAEIARKAGAVVVEHSGNRGKAHAVNTGFAYVRELNPTALVMLDGDGQHCADDIPAVLEPIQHQTADVVVGSRFLEVKSGHSGVSSGWTTRAYSCDKLSLRCQSKRFTKWLSGLFRRSTGAT